MRSKAKRPIEAAPETATYYSTYNGLTLGVNGGASALQFVGMPGGGSSYTTSDASEIEQLEAACVAQPDMVTKDKPAPVRRVQFRRGVATSNVITE